MSKTTNIFEEFEKRSYKSTAGMFSTCGSK